MATGTLKITSNFGNKYELAKARLKNNPLYKESHWINASRGNGKFDLDMYVSTLDNSDKIDVDKLYDEYNYEYGDAATQMAALYNEAFKDQFSSSTHTMERFKYDESGNQIFKDGKPVTEKYEVSDYDYYKNVIKQQNDLKYNQWLKEQDLERKNSMSAFERFTYSSLAVPLSTLSGAASKIDALVDTVSAIIAGTSAATSGGNFTDAFTKAISDSDWRPFDDFQNWVTDFESRYTNLRDLDGNYTNIGKYVGGVSYTVGQMLPSILLSKVGGVVGGVLGKTSIAKAASIASQVVYYEGMTANNIRDMYNQFANEQVSVPTAQILSNAAIKSTLEFGIEKLLGKILGGTAIDEVVFGRTAGRTSAKGTGNLTMAGLKRILKDAGQEGLEEVLQETSGFLVDVGYSILANENFGEISDLTFQSLMDAFVIASIVSIGGSAVGILKADGKTMKTLDKGGKIAAWEYGLNLQSFVENYNKVLDADKKARKAFSKETDVNKIDSSINKQAKITSAAMAEMYASYRILASIYGEIGQQRFASANAILNKITSDIEYGKFDLKYVKTQADIVYNSILGDRTLSKEFSEKLRNDIEDAKITEIADRIVSSDDIHEEAGELLKDLDLEELIISKDGNNIVQSKELKSAIIPKNYLKSASTETILYSFCEQDLIDKIVNDDYYKFITKDIVDTYEEITGNSNVKVNEAVTSLLFDPDLLLYKSLLLTANKDMYKFLSNLASLIKNVKIDKLSDSLYKKTLDKCFTNMRSALVEYLKNQPNADYNLDFLTDAQKNSITKIRWSQDIYGRVVRGEKLSKTDFTILKNRVNYANITEDSKRKMLENIKSGSADVRYNAMNAINYAYEQIFTSKYDGKTYMPNTSIPNVVFNNYLQKLNLTLSTLNSVDLLTDSDISIINDSYGEVNEATVIKYRIEQFSSSVNGAYSLELSDDGKYYVIDKNGKRVGYSVYNAKIDNIVSGDKLYKDGKEVSRTVLNVAGNLKSVVQSLLKPSLSKFTANMVSISDVIIDSSLLNDSLYKSIQSSYGKVTPETTFIYLREFILSKTGNITVTVMPDGDYAFVNVKPMEGSLISQNVTISKDTKASEIFKPNLLKGMLKDLNIVLINDNDVVAEYRPFKLEKIKGKNYKTYDNTIYINKTVAKNGGDLLKFALLHEFQHALQYENRLNLGMDYQFLRDVSSDIKSKIISDVKLHMPNLFNNNMDSADIENAVQEFVYNTSGESMAMGLDASSLVDFYPTIVNYTKDGTEITFPWGSTYNLQNGVKVLGIKVQNGPLTNSNNDLLLKFTKPYNLIKFKEYPRSSFVMPTGELRIFDKGTHDEVIVKSGIEDVKYLKTIPQVYVEEDFARVKIPNSMTNDCILSVMSIMDYLYEKGIDFDLGGMDVDSNPFAVTVGSDEADNSDDLLELYARYKTESTGEMSLRKLASNLWEVENLSDLGLTESKVVTDSRRRLQSARSKYGYSDVLYHAKFEHIDDLLTHWEGVPMLTNNAKSEIIKRTVKNALLDEVGLEYKNYTLEYLHKHVAPTLTYDEFINFDIPYLRMQKRGELNNSPFVSITAGIDSVNSVHSALQSFYNMSSHKDDVRECYLIIGTFKPRDSLAYLQNSEGEVLIEPSKLVGGRMYSIKFDPDVNSSVVKYPTVKDTYGYEMDNYSLTSYTDKSVSYENYLLRSELDMLERVLLVSNETGELFNPEISNTEKLVRNSTVEVDGKHHFLYTYDGYYHGYYKFTDVETGEEFNIKSSEYDIERMASYDLNNKQSSNLIKFLNELYSITFEMESSLYLVSPEGRVITAEEVNSELGDYIPKMSLSESKKSVNSETEAVKVEKKKYKRQRKKSNVGRKRYVSQKEAKGTALEKFTEKYTKTQMPPELQDFILSTDKNKVVKELQDKIDNGTIVVADVMDYFRNTDLKNMDDTTFKAINDAFFHNEVVKTKEDLQYYLDNTPSYYAARVIVRESKNRPLLLVDDANITKAAVENIKNLPKDTPDKKLYEKLYTRFHYKGKNDYQSAIDINEKYLKWLWMEYYDGSLQQAGRIANIVRYAAINGWNITGEIKTKSMEDVVTDELTLADTIEDRSALQDMMDIVLNSDRSAKISSLKYKLSKKMFDLIAETYGRTEEAAKSALKTKRIIDELTPDQLNEVFIRQMLSDVLGLKFESLENKAVDKALEKVERTSWSIVNNINSNIRTIKNKLSPKEVKLFVKHNADLFTDELKLRPEIYKTYNVKGRLIYKDSSELMELWDKVRDLKDDVIQGAYESKSRLNKHIKFKKAMVELNEAVLKSLEKSVQKAKDIKTVEKPVKKAKDIKIVTIEVADDVITVDTTKPIPKALERILDFEFSKVVKSRTQYLTNDDDYHFQTNLNTFLSYNAEYLESLTQQDVDDIIDYYTNSEILKANMSESKYRLYNAVQLYMSVYLLKGNKLGWFTLSEDQYKALEKRTEVTVSVAAQQLANWKAAMKMLKPEEVIINSLARSAGIEFSTEDVESLSNAISTGDIKRIQEAKKKAYMNASTRYKGRKSSFWDKLFQFERMAMLSGPGTWVRNIVSNVMVGGIYVNDKQVVKGLLDTAESVGNSASKLIEKLFPKKKWKRDKQYKIIGTVVTSDVKNFIDNNLIKNGLLNELVDGLSKYDVRKGKGRTANENLTDMITRSIATKIFYNNTSDNKYLDKTYKFIFKMLSDDKYVTRNMLKYLGKMLVEDGTNLSNGLSPEVTNTIAEAYTLAAQDYMHKSNVWNKIDAAIRNRTNSAVYFAYKQFFPFANTSWNWFTEGLNYTPVGLISSIVKYAKLESTIEKLDNARQKGETVMSSRFAEYSVKRNIGKGVIGTIGTVIGMLLTVFGVVKLDDEDDKYKITVGDTSVDITGLFGTQGIFLGMSTTQSIIDAVQGKDFDLLDVVSRALDTMLVDSTFADVWTTIRYNPSLGDYIAMLPMKVLDSCLPNFFKTLTSISNVYKVKYNQGVLGKIEKLAVDAVPGLAYAFPHVIDVYTGEKQIMYKAQFITNLVNKLNPLKIKPMNITDMEKTAVSFGVNKTMLTGKYDVNDEDVILGASEVEKLNVYYGELNKKDLAELTSNKVAYKVQNEDGTYSKLRYSQMTEKQKRAAFEQVMSKNSSYAKIYMLTSNGYVYYASNSEYDNLRKLGITKNVYKETNKNKGFVKSK